MASISTSDYARSAMSMQNPQRLADMDRIDHFHAFSGVTHDFLGELLVVKAGNAAADQQCVALLFDVQLAEGVDGAGRQCALGTWLTIFRRKHGHETKPFHEQ